MLKDEQWECVAPLLPGKAGDPGRTGSDNRLFLEAVLWMVRTGAPWRDLPEAFGSWNTVFRRFRRWAQAGVFECLFQLCQAMPTSSTPSSMAPSSGSTSTVPAHEEDLWSGHRALARRPDDQDRRAGGCAGQSGGVRPSAGAAA